MTKYLTKENGVSRGAIHGYEIDNEQPLIY